MKRWSREEIDLLRSLYSQKDIPMSTLLKAFPGRSEKAIQHKAASLDIKRRKPIKYRHFNYGSLPPFPRGSYRRDLRQKFRSGWEANFARYILYKGLTYVYEPETFNLGWATYTPDFFIPEKNLYVEVKGVWTEKAKKKVKVFRRLYPTKKLEIFDEKAYKKVKSKYSHLIKNWE